MKKIIYLIITVIITQSGLIAQVQHPVNSNYLIKNGVSPRVIDAAASIFMQDGKFTNEVFITHELKGIKKEYHIELIYDPNYKEGMDVRIVNLAANLSKKEKKNLQKYIEASHYFSRMSRNYLYDESSLKIIKNKADSTVLEFYYQNKDIDPYLKNIKRLKGTIYFVNNQLEKIILINIKPLKKKFDKFKRTVYYAKTNDGGYIVSSMEEEGQSSKKNIKYKISSNTLSYSGKNEQELLWNNKKEKSIHPENAETINVKLGGTLPFLGKTATKMGIKLPRPFGVDGFVYAHDQLMKFTGLSVNFNKQEWVDLQNLFMLDDSKVSQSTFMTLTKGDVWIFPFLNIMAIAGAGENKLDGELVVNEDLRDFINNLPGYIIDIPSIPRAVPIKMSITSEVYGGGLTLAGGIGSINLSVNYQLMFTKIVEANTTNMVNIISPMVGYMTPFGLNVMAGAQGQFYNTQINGFFELPDSNGDLYRLDYIVDFEPIKWNALIGLYKSFNKHWEMSFQAGFGDRTSITAIFGYRF